MNAVNLVTYLLAVVFWVATAIYALLASREFIVEQFLKPELFAPLTIFARKTSAGSFASPCIFTNASKEHSWPWCPNSTLGTS